MPGPLKEVQVHLVELDEGYLLVDTGWGLPETLRALEDGLKTHGVAWTDIKTLVVTHLHPDHVGNAQEVLDRSGARYLMHQVDAENLATVAKMGRSPHFDEGWKIAGVPAERQQELDLLMRENRRSFPARQPDWPLKGGERIAIRGGTLEVVWTPGHSAGHICLYSPEHRYLIAGDHILEFITPNVGWRPDGDMLGQFLDSLDRVEALDVDWVIPSHGKPFSGLKARVEHIRKHHDQRFQKILNVITEQPLSVHDLVGKIWRRKLGALEHNFAVLELLAHMEYMRRRGPVSADARPDGALEWRPY